MPIFCCMSWKIMMWMLFLYYLGKWCHKELFSPEPKNRTSDCHPEAAGHSPVPPLFVCLFVCTTLAFCVCECMYVDVFLVCLLQIQAKSVVSRTPVLGLQHLQQTCFVFVMFTFIYSCVCVACEWEQLKTHLISENLTKISHPNCKCNC